VGQGVSPSIRAMKASISVRSVQLVRADLHDLVAPDREHPVVVGTVRKAGGRTR